MDTTVVFVTFVFVTLVVGVFGMGAFVDVTFVDVTFLVEVTFLVGVFSELLAYSFLEVTFVGTFVDDLAAARAVDSRVFGALLVATLPDGDFEIECLCV